MGWLGSAELLLYQVILAESELTWTCNWTGTYKRLLLCVWSLLHSVRIRTPPQVVFETILVPSYRQEKWGAKGRRDGSPSGLPACHSSLSVPGSAGTQSLQTRQKPQVVPEIPARQMVFLSAFEKRYLARMEKKKKNSGIRLGWCLYSSFISGDPGRRI